MTKLKRPRVRSAEKTGAYVPVGDAKMMYADHQAEIERLKKLLAEVHALLASTDEVSIYTAVSDFDRRTRNMQWWGLSLQLGDWCQRAAHVLGLVDVKKGG